jgi:hypothetical protein
MGLERVGVGELPQPDLMLAEIGGHTRRRGEEKGALGSSVNAVEPPGKDDQYLLGGVLDRGLGYPEAAKGTPKKLIILADFPAQASARFHGG